MEQTSSSKNVPLLASAKQDTDDWFKARNCELRHALDFGYSFTIDKVLVSHGAAMFNACRGASGDDVLTNEVHASATDAQGPALSSSAQVPGRRSAKYCVGPCSTGTTNGHTRARRTGASDTEIGKFPRSLWPRSIPRTSARRRQPQSARTCRGSRSRRSSRQGSPCLTKRARLREARERGTPPLRRLLAATRSKGRGRVEASPLARGVVQESQGRAGRRPGVVRVPVDVASWLPLVQLWEGGGERVSTWLALGHGAVTKKRAGPSRD